MNHAAAESKTPVSVITGFLGSGKTTLLNALLKHPGMAETAVLVNEFGEIGIDHLLRHVDHAGGHDDGVRALCLSADAPIEIYRFVRWVEKLLEENGDRVLRLKGILDVAGDTRPVVVHGVQHIFHPLDRLTAWPGPERGSRLVLIVRDLDVEPIAREFRRLVELNHADF